MDFKDYQMACERTAKQNVPAARRFTEFCFGLAGETGETIEVIKKHLFHGHELNKEMLKEELGDLMWYISTTATTADLDLEDIAENNINKLRKRYPDKFTSDNSINRIL